MKRRLAMKVVLAAILVFSIFAAFSVSYGYPIRSFSPCRGGWAFSRRRS